MYTVCNNYHVLCVTKYTLEYYTLRLCTCIHCTIAHGVFTFTIFTQCKYCAVHVTSDESSYIRYKCTFNNYTRHRKPDN